MPSSWPFLVGFLLVAPPYFTTAYASWQPISLSEATRIRMTATDCENVRTVDVLSLDSIRSSLIRQEETIIFALIERAQFRKNAIVYRRGGFGDLGTPIGSTPGDTHEKLSFLEYMLVGTEVLHCGVRRYTSPEEHAFFPERLPEGQMEALPLLEYPQELLSSVGGASAVNFNKLLLEKYIKDIVPSVGMNGDDEQHGSTVLCDIAALQALSRRVHYGKFVAESKYRSDPNAYQNLVDAGDAAGVMRLLTNQAVEEKVLRRAKLKAATYGTEPLLANMPPIECSGTATIVAAAAASAVVAALEALGSDESRSGKIDPAVIEYVYREIIIPLTKVVEVAYLYRRCGREPPPEYQCL
jgi:chorismate mutase